MNEELKTIPATSEISTRIEKGRGSITVETIAGRIDRQEDELRRINQALLNERLNNVTVFGIFASLVTFFSVQIQIFKNIDNFWLLIGLSAFLVSSLLLFVFSIHSIIQNRSKWQDLKENAIFWIFIFFLLFALIIFFFNSKH